MGRTVILFLTALLIPGCYITNMVHVQIYPDSGLRVTFTSAGDSADVFNNDFPHPAESALFLREVEKKVDSEGEPYWVMTTSGFIESGNEMVFESDTPLLSPIEYNRNEGWFSTNYSFVQVFRGFQLSRKYPAFIQAYTEDALEDSAAWLPEYHQYALRSALEDLSVDMEELQSPGLVDRLSNHVTNHFNYVLKTGGPILPAQPSPEDLKKLFSPFLNDLPPSFGLSLSLSLRPYLAELSQIIDLKGELIFYSLLMPGRLLTTDADSTSGDTLKWTIDSEDLLNDPRLISAYSIIFKEDNIRVLILTLVGILILGLLAVVLKKKLKH